VKGGKWGGSEEKRRGERRSEDGNIGHKSVNE
jgi:hypothetical protein